MIDVRDVTVELPGRTEPVLDHVTFRLAPGERAALLGGNGSGKTTLARLLNGTLLPTRGRVLVQGYDTRDPHARFDVRRRVGLLFQDPDNQFVTTTVEREVALPEADDATCRRYYANNIARFRAEDIYEVSHILFAADPADKQAFAQARADATAVLETLKERPETFGALAQAYSRCPSAAQGGNLGQVTRGQTTPEFEQALFALDPGKISEKPVPTRYGWHIIRLDRKVEGRQLPFELVAGRIAEYLREQVERRATAQYIARLVSRAHITGIELAGAEAHRVN